MNHKRYLIILLLFLLTLITFMDRICISTASDLIMSDLHISSQVMGYIFAVFALSYALFQIPSGIMADTIGPKKVLGFVVAFWSLFTALTGVAWSAISMLVFRFFFGAGEAGAFPGATRAVYNWMPAKERGVANGIFHSGGRVGAALSLLIMPWLIAIVGWRWMFIINGGIGVLWIIAWIFFFKDQPRNLKWMSKREVEYIEDGKPKENSVSEKIPLGVLLTSSNMGLAFYQYFASGVTYFISLSWLFPYMKSQWGEESVKYTPIPLLVGMFAHWTSGSLISYLHHKGFSIASRKIPAMAGFLMGAVGLILCTQMKNLSAPVFITCFSLAIFGVELTIAPSWTFCMDVGGNSSGAVSGAMNMVGNIGSATSAVIFPLFVSAITIPFFAEKTGTANSFFIFAALLNVLGFFSWILINPKKKLDLSISPRKVRLRLILLLSFLFLIFLGFFIYKTFIIN